MLSEDRLTLFPSHPTLQIMEDPVLPATWPTDPTGYKGIIISLELDGNLYAVVGLEGPVDGVQMYVARSICFELDMSG